MGEKVRTTVKIYGSEYRVESVDPEEYIQKVAFYVDKTMKTLAANDIRLSTTLAAVLTAINIADERFKLLSENEGLKAELARRRAADEKNEQLIKNTKAEIEALKNENERLKIALARAQTKLEGR